MRSRALTSIAVAASVLFLSACGSDDEPTGQLSLEFKDGEGTGRTAGMMNGMIVTTCIDATEKPTHQVRVRNPGSTSVTFAAGASGALVEPRNATLAPGQELRLTVELVPFVTNITPEH